MICQNIEDQIGSYWTEQFAAKINTLNVNMLTEQYKTATLMMLSKDINNIPEFKRGFNHICQGRN